MYDYNRRSSALLLALCLAIGCALVLPPGAARAEAAEFVNIGLTVQLQDGEYLLNDSTTEMSGDPLAVVSSGYAYFSDGTLILNNFTHVGTGAVVSTSNSAIISAVASLNIKLEGENKLTVDVSGGDTMGIYVREINVPTGNSNLTISGEGSLLIDMAQNWDMEYRGSWGINVSNTLILDGANVEIINSEFGISSGDLYIQNGSVVTAGTLYGNSLIIEDSTVYAANPEGLGQGGIGGDYVSIHDSVITVRVICENIENLARDTVDGILGHVSLHISGEDTRIDIEAEGPALRSGENGMHIEQPLRILQPFGADIGVFYANDEDLYCDTILNTDGTAAGKVRIEALDYIPGDVNHDGRIGLDDAVLCARIAVEPGKWDNTPEHMRADICQDGASAGKIDLLDVQAICAILVGA